MDGRGGCCIARYAGGGAYDMSKVDRIMLRFRPIAPKPASSSSVSGGSTPEIGEHSGKGGRGKRKYVRDNGNNNRRCNNKKRKASPEEKPDSSSSLAAAVVEPVVTLPLLPESPEPKDTPARVSPEARDAPIWLSFDNSNNKKKNNIELGVCKSSDRTVKIRRPVRLLGSCVTVECVTDTWMDGNGLGCTDEERKMNLWRDTCPGFISDGFGRVTWTNGAYRKLIRHGEENGEEEEEEMKVWLVMNERVPMAVTLTYPAFTCRVRLQYMYGGKEKTSLTLPCDVWRMSGCGGFAWRLDVKAALCLGR